MRKFLRILFLFFFFIGLIVSTILSLRYFNTEYKGGLKIVHNSGLASGKIKSTFSDFEIEFKCDYSCEIPDLSPGKYFTELKSSGYKDFSIIVEIENNELYELFAELDKITQINFIGDKDNEINENVLLLKNKKKIGDSDVVKFYGSEAYFISRKGNNNYFSSTIEGDFEDILLPKNDYSKYMISRIDMTVGEFFLSSINLNVNFIIDTKSSKVYSFNFSPEILYLKKVSDFDYFIVTSEGLFNYNILSEKFDYKNIFEDFIEYNGQYIGIVRKDTDFSKKYLIENDVVLSYDIDSKSFKEIGFLPVGINKILLIGGKVYLYDIGGNKYLINNL